MIAHFDIDAFYASVAQRDNPELRGKPIAISRDSRRSVVLTASYEARPFGVRSAMPLYRAKEMCPGLLVVPPDGAAYRVASDIVFGILQEDGYDFESLSLDEAYLNLAELEYEAAIDYCVTLRRRVFDATSLTISGGLGSSKLVAKIASDVAKPDGLRAVPIGEEAAFLAPLPIGRLYGIGPKSERRLVAEGLLTIGQLAEMSDERLYELFGRHGKEARDLARGIDMRVVSNKRERKSLSSETTFEHDIVGETAILPVLHELATEVAEGLAKRGLRATSIAVKIKRTDFTIAAKQTQLTEPSADARVIFAAARHCYREGDFAKNPIRLIGVRAASLTTDTVRQLPLF